MSTEAPEAPVDQSAGDPPAAPEVKPEEFDPERAKAKIAKVNSEAQSLRQQLKEARDAVKKYEDANKSETDKLTEKATTAEKRAAEAEAKLMRLEVAAAKGLTPNQAKRLVGSTQEELEADADELLADLGGSKPPAKVPGKPRENLRGGGDPEQDPEETDPAKLAARIPRRF